MTIEQILEEVKGQAGNAEPFNGKLKLMIGDTPIFIDGTGEKNEVTNEDAEADCVISASEETFEKMKNGDLNPMMAVMGGKVKIEGNMGLAMKLQSLL